MIYSSSIKLLLLLNCLTRGLCMARVRNTPPAAGSQDPSEDVGSKNKKPRRKFSPDQVMSCSSCTGFS